MLSAPGDTPKALRLAAALLPRFAVGATLGTQDLPSSTHLGSAHDTLPLHALYEVGRPVVADAETALQVAGGSLALAAHDRNGPLVEVVELRTPHTVFGLSGTRFGDTRNVTGRTLVAQIGSDALNLLVGHERPVHAHGAASAVGEEHVSLTQQLLGALLIEDRAAIEFGGDLVADARWEVGLDGTGHDIDRRPLGRHDEVNAGRTRHLRQASHRAIDVSACDQHEIGELVDHDHDEGQGRQLALRARGGGSDVPLCLAHARVVGGDVAHG